MTVPDKTELSFRDRERERERERDQRANYNAGLPSSY